MAQQDPRELGLFPLGLVILPGERIPLHIFEPRYRALVADCALESHPFVISLATEQGVARVGCTTNLDSLLRRFDDGRMNIVVQGGERVEILEQTSGQAYITARVRSLPDRESPADPAVASQVLEQFRRLAEAVAGAGHDPEARDGVPLSYAVAGAMELDAVTKQQLLEERSEAARLAAVAELMENALAGLDRQEVAAERARGNGKVTLS